MTRRTPTIQNSPNQVASLEKHIIGGIEQWLLIRGQDCNKPILLWIHGGPGAAQIGFGRHYCADLEQDFIVVNWDQRGAGLSYSSQIPLESMTIDQIIEDLIEIVQLLCSRFKQQKVYLLGHSWGTILSVLVIQRHPELFHGFFSVCQLVNFNDNERVSYEFTLRRARETDNRKANTQLEGIGFPPWVNDRAERIHNNWLQKFRGGLVYEGSLFRLLYKPLLKGTEYRFFDLINWIRGQFFSMSALQKETSKIDFFDDIQEIKVPIAFFCGRHDFTTPSELAEEFFEGLQAPNKRLIWFENSAHSPWIEEQAKFVEVVRSTVRAWE